MATTTSTKRPSTDTGGPPAKRPNLAMSPLDIGPAAGEEDLDMKVLQVQNQKLSERLRERNRHREQLESQIEEMEKKHEDHLRLQVALRQHFKGLRERLLVAMVPLGSEGCVMNEDEVENVEEVATLHRVTHALYECIEKLCRAHGALAHQEKPEDNSGAFLADEGGLSQREFVRSRSLALLEELSKHHKEEAETKNTQENMTVLETKCDKLQEEVANLRFSLEQSQTRGDRLESRLEAALATVHSGPVLHAQASEEGPTQSLEDGREGSTTSTTSARAGARSWARARSRARAG